MIGNEYMAQTGEKAVTAALVLTEIAAWYAAWAETLKG